MTQTERIAELVQICRVQIILANRKNHKLRIYEDFLRRIEKVANES